MSLLKKTLWICTIFLLFSSLLATTSISKELENNDVIYTPSTTTWLKENGKSNTTVLWMGIRNVYEDGDYKPREQARSFKEDSNIKCIVNFDGYNIAECSDYNETSRTIKLSISESRWDMFWENPIGTSFKTPLKKYHLEFNESTEKFERIYNKEFENNISFEWYNLKKEYLIKVNPDEILEFGENSTEIILQDADIENWADAWVQSDQADYHFGSSAGITMGVNAGRIFRGTIKFNINDTNLPAGQQIDDAQLHINVDSGSTAQDISLYHVLDQSCTDDTSNHAATYPLLTYNGHPCGASWDNSSSCNLTVAYIFTLTTTGWYNLSSTNILRSAYANGEKNLTIGMRGEEGASLIHEFHSKENGVTANNPYFNYTYSTAAPPNTSTIISLQIPKNSTSSFASDINFTYNVTDSGDTVDNCSLFLMHGYGSNWERNKTDSNIEQTINQTHNISLAYENVYWKVGCYDDEALQGNSSTFNFTTRIKQYGNITVTLHIPKNSTSDYTPHINFTYNTSISFNSIDNCSLYLQHSFGSNWERNKTDTEIEEIINQTHNISLAYENIYWKVGCTSDQSVETNSSAYNYTRLKAFPKIKLYIPKNSTSDYISNINFTYNVSIPYGSVSSCSLYLQHSFGGNWENNLTDTNIEQTINQTHNISLAYENVYWKVGCLSDLSVEGNSSTFNYTRLPAYPNVDLNFPKDNTQSYSPYANFTYNVTIPYGAIDTCYLWLNSSGNFVLNDTDTSIQKLFNQTFNLTTLPFDDTHWLVECKSYLNIRANSSEFNYSRLRAYPTVNLQFPKEAHIYTTNLVNLTYNVSLLYGSIDECSLWLNHNKLGDDTNIELDINQTFNLTIPPGHDYNWTVECMSNFGIRANSSMWNFSYNIAPTVPTIILPANQTIYASNSSINITCGGSVDAQDTVNYEFWGGVGMPHNLLQNSSLTTFAWNITTPSWYYYRCRANDNRSHSSFSGLQVLYYSQIYANCTADGVKAESFNFSFMDENGTKLYNVSFEATFKVWGNDSSLYQIALFDNVVKDEIKYCLGRRNASFPDQQHSLYVDAIIKYSKSGYDSRNYFLDEDDMVTLVRQEVILYLAETSKTTEISITVTDAADIPLENIEVQAWFYDVGTNTYSQVQTEITNSRGKCTMDLIQDNYYMFKFYENGVLKDSTSKFKLTETSITFKITVAEKPLEPTTDLNILLHNFSWVNSTRIIRFNYSRADFVNNLNQICWVVNNLSAQNISSIHSHCFTIGSGTYSGSNSYTIPSSHGYYRAYAYVLINGIKYTIDEFEIDWRKVKGLFGDEGLLLGVLIIMGLGGLGLATRNPSAMIMMVLLGIIINHFAYLWILPWYALASIISVGIIFLIIIRA